MAALLTITLTGFVTTIAQIVLLRELLVRFYGNELTMGLVLACWLIWSAVGCRLAAKVTPPHTFSNFCLPGFILLLLAILLPISVMIIRAAGILWHLSAGEMPGLWPMVQICLLSTGLFSPFSGALFSLCWTLYQNLPAEGGKHRPIVIFMGEGLGAAASGLVFYAAVNNHYPVMTIVWITSGLILPLSAGWVRPWRMFKDRIGLRVAWIGMVLIFCYGVGLGAKIEKMSRQWQWGDHVVAVEDTAYHNVALTREKEQYSFFSNGLWLFSTPDLPSREHAVHPALLQHPAPKTVLLLGGGIAGLVEEIQKHPGIERIEYVDPDPDLIRFAQHHLPPETVRSLTSSRLHLIHQHIGAFLRGDTSRFDVILMNIGDPVNAELNQFYTEEFFSEIQNHLSSTGVFSFAVTGSEDMLGAVQLRYLKSIYRTLTGVFPDVTLYPGNPFRFFAAHGAGTLARTPDSLVARIRDRNLALSYVREDTLRDGMNPIRLAYFQSMLEDKSPDVKTNRDFSPTCYREALLLWSAPWHPLFRDTIQWMVTDRPGQLWGLLAAASTLLFLMTLKRRIELPSAIASSVLVAGGTTMILQMVLLLAFQILEGGVYLHLALILSFFMAGLAAGAGGISIRVTSLPLVTRLTRVQALIGLYPLLLIALLYLLHGKFDSNVFSTLVIWFFSILSLVAGALGGALFSLAVEALAETGFSLKDAGGKLYALDLIGAATGLLVATFLLLPVYGLIQALAWVSSLTLIMLIPFYVLKFKG
jgi:spermidine synthase